MPYAAQFPLSIYLHIPFCGTKCTYCAFNTYTHLEHHIPEFVRAMCREIELTGAGAAGRPVHSVFFGGGTPSLLTPEQFARILDAVHRTYEIAEDAEISIEANPNDLNEAYLRDLRGLGINRLSIGVQTTNAAELALFRRRHDNDAVARSVRDARAAGFDNLNLDLMYGVPHQTLDGWASSLNETLALAPDHVSLYALTLEEGTPMHTWVTRGALPEPDDDLSADMYDLATGTLANAGYEQYEISNWARPGHACRHNIQYWRNLEYLGLGPGAHGYAADTRYSVLRSPHQYMSTLLDEKSTAGEAPYPLTPVAETRTHMDRQAEMADTLLMGLRLTSEGIIRADFARRFGVDVIDEKRQLVERFESGGLLEVTDERLRLTERGRLLSNLIFRELV